MLAQARERSVYDKLVKGELTAYLAGCRDAFDVIVSADTLVYFGPLDAVAIAAEQCAAPGRATDLHRRGVGRRRP